jgi:hypothetical protein
MMTLNGWVRSGAVSGVECPVRQFGPAFRWNSRRDWIRRDWKEPRQSGHNPSQVWLDAHGYIIRVKDLDFERNEVVVRAGKGGPLDRI